MNEIDEKMNEEPVHGGAPASEPDDEVRAMVNEEDFLTRRSGNGENVLGSGPLPEEDAQPDLSCGVAHEREEFHEHISKAWAQVAEHREYFPPLIREQQVGTNHPPSSPSEAFSKGSSGFSKGFLKGFRF